MASNRRTRKAQRKTVDARREEVFHYRGLTIEELQAMPPEEFVELLPSRARRFMRRGLSDNARRLLARMERTEGPIRTHARTQVVLPHFVGREMHIHNGREFVRVTIQPEMIGHRLGEFAITRKDVSHTGPGVGATRSSKYMPLK